MYRCGKRLISLPFYPTSTTDRQWLCAYNSFDLLEQVDIKELKRSEILLPEKRDQLVKILENRKNMTIRLLWCNAQTLIKHKKPD
ncbi:hypothetical protein [Parabacteroides johnsonii]|uniref:hypothetical protein n=1 Tax=Parabacteroides johnsonii TaxID=387661 RepID=UPI0021CB4465|nr:hypothetical protein [Parabacteroides johnsonii]